MFYNYIMMMVVQFCEYTKNHGTYTLKGLQHVNYILRVFMVCEVDLNFLKMLFK